MTPYYEYAGITIYLGDCREILPGLPKVDLLALVEINEHYCEIAAKRMSQEVLPFASEAT